MTPRVIPAIRRATAEDAGLLAELGARTFHDTFAADNKPDDMAAYLAAAFSPQKQATELADPRTIFLIAELNGRAVGYAALRADGVPACVTGAKPIELARLYVTQEWHGSGVGAALLRACLGEAQRAGYRTVWLGVWERNRRAQAFYRKWDFNPVGEHTFQLGADPQTDVLMERALL